MCPLIFFLSRGNKPKLIGGSNSCNRLKAIEKLFGTVGSNVLTKQALNYVHITACCTNIGCRRLLVFFFFLTDAVYFV